MVGEKIHQLQLMFLLLPRGALDPLQEEKYIVFKSCSWELFSRCPICSKQCQIKEKCRKGSKVFIRQICKYCSCGYERIWDSFNKSLK